MGGEIIGWRLDAHGELGGRGKRKEEGLSRTYCPRRSGTSLTALFRATRDAEEVRGRTPVSDDLSSVGRGSVVAGVAWGAPRPAEGGWGPRPALPGPGRRAPGNEPRGSSPAR